MNQYRCEMAHLRASETGKRAMVERLLRNQAQESVCAKSRHPLRGVLIAAATAVMLTTAALALSPTIREALANALGGFAPYAQDMTREELSCTDQGVKLTVVSALNDGNTIVVYFEAQDLSGDRLDEATRTNAQLQWPENVAWKQGVVFPAEQIAYDERTKTALYCTKFIGDGIPAETLTVQLYGQVFAPGTHEFDQHQSLPDEVLSRAVLQTETLPDGGVVLVPLQNPTSLLDDCLTLSSCGFGEDGQLHVQLCTKTGTIASLRPVVQSKKFLSGQSEANYYPMDREARFDREGMTYYDFSFHATRENADDVVIAQLLATVRKEEIKGEWRLDVRLESQGVTTILMEQSATALAVGPKATKMFLTPISCTIECDPQDGESSLGYPLSVFYSDGSVVSALKCDSNYYSGSYATNHWTFPQPIEPEEVTAIALGLWYVPIENGVAQPGHWLAEQP